MRPSDEKLTPLESPGGGSEERLVSAGLLSIIASIFMMLAYSFAETPLGIGLGTLGFGIFSVVGLMLVMRADLDLNVYVRENQLFVGCFVVIHAGSLGVGAILQSSSGGYVNWLIVVPWIALLRFEQVVQMREGYPLFTQLFLATMVLDAFANAWLDFIAKCWYAAATWILGALWLTATMSWYAPGNLICAKRSAEHTASLQFKMTTYAYLLAFGVGKGVEFSICSRYDDEHVRQSPTATACIGIFVAIHVLPPVLMLTCKERVMRRLGIMWLNKRSRESASRYEQRLSFIPGAEARGNLIEVEEAILSSADLNRTIVLAARSSSHKKYAEDEYTLLHFAVINNHLDALQRLLLHNTVEINKPTPRRGQSALFIAAAEGRIHAARMLLEHKADANALSDEGQSPLIVAAAQGDLEMMMLLQEYGADTEMKWMGLRAEDVVAQTGSADEEGRPESLENPPMQRPLQGHPSSDSDWQSRASSLSNMSSYSSGASSTTPRRLVAQTESASSQASDV